MSRVLIIGDVIDDVYVHGSVLGVSAETPTLVMREHNAIKYSGGADLVYFHLRNILTWEELPVYQYNEQPVVTKTRFFVGNYKLFQTDKFHEIVPIDLTDLQFEIEKYDKVVICDNRHGTINKQVARCIVDTCNRLDKQLYVDVQVSQNESNHKWYEGAQTMLLNKREFDACTPSSGISEYSLDAICKFYKWKNVIVKLGQKGSAALIEGKYITTQTPQVKAVDTCGAGDAFLAVVVSRKLIDEETLQVANNHAAETCTRIGTGIQ